MVKALEKRRGKIDFDILGEIKKTPTSSVETLMQRWNLSEEQVLDCLNFLNIEPKWEIQTEYKQGDIPKTRRITLIQSSQLIGVPYDLVHKAVLSGDLPVQRPKTLTDDYWVDVNSLDSLREKLNNGGLTRRRGLRSEELFKGYEKYRRSFDFVDKLSHILALPILTRQEEVSLLEKSIAGDECAVHDLIESNVRLVFSKAFSNRKVLCSSLTFEDLFQEGVLGLQRAILGYDLSKEAKLSTYAVWWINNSISRAISDSGETIRIPVHVYERRRKISKFAIDFMGQYGREPTNEEISQSTGVQLNRVRSDREFMNYRPLFLDEELESGDNLHEFIPDTKTKNARDTADANYEEFILLKTLDSIEASERNKNMLRDRFGINDQRRECSLEEVSERAYRETGQKVTRERVRQITDKLLNQVGAIIDYSNGVDIYAQDYVPLAERVEIKFQKNKRIAPNRKEGLGVFTRYGIPMPRKEIFGELDEKLTRENVLPIISRMNAPVPFVNLFFDRFGLNPKGEYFSLKDLKDKYCANDATVKQISEDLLDKIGRELDKREGVNVSHSQYVPYSSRFDLRKFTSWVKARKKMTGNISSHLFSKETIPRDKEIDYRRVEYTYDK